MPIKNDTIPPKYESKANKLRYNIGCVLLPAQAINISGGTSPNKDSEAKNTENIFKGE